LGVLFLSALALGTVAALPGGANGPSPGIVATCPGSTVSSSYSGNVSIAGGPLPASYAVGISLSYNYSVEVEISNRTTGALISGHCELLQETTSSGANGSFSFALTLPASHCYGDDCSHDLGPYGPVGLGLAGAAPAGYEAVAQANGTSLALTIVAELGGLALDPGGSSRTLSPNAPGAFVARPVTAVGSPSPLTPTFLWNLTGPGWSFDGTKRGAKVTVQALPGAGLAELSVAASAEVGSNQFSAGPVLVDLESIPTAFIGGDANRTDLDVGGSVSFTVAGSGAPGYAYSASVAPGLGLTSVVWPCSSTPSNGDGVTISCTGEIAYPAAGLADPTAELTNTYSTAEGSLPSVTVAPLPAIALTPQSLVGYTGDPLPIRISAIPGSGTPPYTLACLEDGIGAPMCSTSPGPNWTFSPDYPAPGNYSGVAWLVDSDGTNRSADFPVTIVLPLALSPIVLPPSIRADAPILLSTRLSGGDLPVRYWWNVSGGSGSVAAGRLSSDGFLNATWVPTAPGSAVVALTVVDSFGTLVQTTVLATVGPAVAAGLAEVTVPGAGPVVVGTAVSVAWQAEDVQGAAVAGFSAAGSFQIVGSDGAPLDRAYVNASGVGPLDETAPGAFAIPASAWELGRLSLTASTTLVGSFQFGLSGSSLLSQTGPFEVDFVADLGHLRFYDPTIALAGARVNDTFWLVADEYGNPAPGAAVDFMYSSEGTSTEAIVPVQAAGGGGTGVWVNFTATTAAGGSREVTDAAGTILLGPIAVPPASSSGASLSASVLTLATLAPVGAVGLGLTAWVQHRRRVSLTDDDRPADGDLRRMVEGRDRVISLVRDARALDLCGIEAAWGSTPVPRDLAGWVASLVADGTLGARTGPDGIARFCLIASADGPPIVLLDPEALARVTATRRELTEDLAPADPESEPRG